MPDKNPEHPNPAIQRQQALSKWETEVGAPADALQRGVRAGAKIAGVPRLTDTELVHLRIRVIALENMVLSLLAQASDRQLELAREMAAYILPRPGFTQHPLTVRAAHQMIDLLDRAGHFRAPTPR
ncbi:MAG: hypothetical protein KGO22_00025 [Gammaproteobacteria bacterium]|nr:hypothetical protein [Gammaproteobacteria bacterium]